ncbi:MAG: energy transducer TonB [Desulfosalsimonadaceae bacterium]
MMLVLLLLLTGGKEGQGRFDRFESIEVQLVSLQPGPPILSSGEDAGGDVFEEVPSEEAPPDAPEEIPLKSGNSMAVEAPSAHELIFPEELRASSAPQVKQPASQRPEKSTRHELVMPEDLERQDSGRRVADAVRRLERETAEDRGRASVRRRIDQLAGETGGQDRPQGTASGSGTASKGQGGSGGRSSEQYTRIQIYQAEVRQQLTKNWAFSEALAGNTRGLESRVVITIMPDGEIRDVWFEKRSGNAYLDESAYKTVMKSNPLPPLPDGMPQYNLMVGFTPGGLQ